MPGCPDAAGAAGSGCCGIIGAMHRTRIKICGLTREADVDAAVEAGADALGFVLWPRSARAVSIERAAVLAARMPPFTQPVLLFVNPTPAEVAAAVQAVPHALLQFHGDETPAQCEAAARPYLRAARMAPGFDLPAFARQFATAQALLLDAHVEGYGGAGKVFDWSLLQDVRDSVPHRLVLSGGLNPANVTDGVRGVRPWAVDVSSGVERAKGVKGAGLLRSFCDAVRAADAQLAAAAPERDSRP
jgi:phosphoribosylanthranilate isomerase